LEKRRKRNYTGRGWFSAHESTILLLENLDSDRGLGPLILNRARKSVTFEAFSGTAWLLSGTFSAFFARFRSFLAFMPNFPFRRSGWLYLLCLSMALLSSCSKRYYNQRTLFRLTDNKGNMVDTSKLRAVVNRAARNYVIQPNDYLEVRVYTNNGERILDPNGELQFGQAGAATTSAPRGATAGRSGGGQRNVGAGAGSVATGSEFLVQADGTVTLPLVDKVKVSGLSLLQADSVLKISYNRFYKESFVTTRVTNNRVFILGVPGGQVISLTNDNMNLLEVLALAGGVDGQGNSSGMYRFGGKANNIRIIRGDLKSPQVQMIDLTTLDGMRRANLQMEPNDIVYVEPIRRPFLDAFFDAAPAISAAALVLNATAVMLNIFLR
jgi:protein involved in polysaccharide export with SLBB domain